MDKFFTDKLSSYASKLDTNSGFCGDRSSLSKDSNSGINQTITYYKAYVRVEESNPTLLCENISDYYTSTSSSLGNKVLIYPIGLLTVDEVMFAGHAGGIVNGYYNAGKSNSNYYLYGSNEFWTMTPAGYYIPYFQNLESKVFSTPTSSSKSIDDSNTLGNAAYKPVINIRTDVTITGSGTMTNPYVVA